MRESTGSNNRIELTALRAAAHTERYAAFDAARAFLARWPLSAKNRTFDYGKKWASI